MSDDGHAVSSAKSLPPPSIYILLRLIMSTCYIGSSYVVCCQHLLAKQVAFPGSLCYVLHHTRTHRAMSCCVVVYSVRCVVSHYQASLFTLGLMPILNDTTTLHCRHGHISNERRGHPALRCWHEHDVTCICIHVVDIILQYFIEASFMKKYTLTQVGEYSMI